MAKKPQRRSHGSVPIVEINGQKVIAKVAGRDCGLKCRPEPDGRYYVVYREQTRPSVQATTKYKTFGTDPVNALRRFFQWQRDMERGVRRRKYRRPRKPRSLTKCPHCDGSGYAS